MFSLQTINKAEEVQRFGGNSLSITFAYKRCAQFSVNRIPPNCIKIVVIRQK